MLLSLISLAVAVAVDGPTPVPSVVSSIDNGSTVCVNPGQLATATWQNALGQTCTWTGVVGSNFGPRGNGNEYVYTDFIRLARSSGQ